MAIDLIHFQMIVAAKVMGKALSAGYPDLLVHSLDIPCGPYYLEKRETSEEVQKHHGFNGVIYDTTLVFEGLGLQLEVIDREKLEGSERVIDLNEPQDLGEYNLVVDPGTSEHCFNIAQAVKNLAGAVKVGGVISQALPMAMFNHGYYNVNPVWFLDFYEQNGFKIEKLVVRDKDVVINDNPTRDRYKGVPDGAVTIMTARRLEKRPFVHPQQQIKT